MIFTKYSSARSKKKTSYKNKIFGTAKSESHLNKVEKSKVPDENTKIDSIKSDSELSNSYERSSEFVSKNDVIDGIKSDSEINRSDGESGLGSSVSVSPDEMKSEENDQYTNIAMSLCGEIRRGKVSLGKLCEWCASLGIVF